ncbi:MAG: SPOR domain-containing protein [Bacteroidia bacterium]
MRYILLFIHALTITIYQFFFVDPVTVKTNFPSSAKAGTQFVSEVTISKGSLAGFAKFQMELPEGFTAEEVDSKGGTFSLVGQTVKIIWTSVPSAADITVSVKITVKAGISGDKTITGKYSYIENNVKQQVEISPVTINVEGEPGAVATNTTTETPTVAATETPTSTPTTTGTVAATGEVTPPATPTEPAGTKSETSPVVSVTRKITPGKTDGSYDVELKIKKDGAKGFAKLQEKIPVGFMASENNSEGTTFSYSETDHIAKFIWTSLPSQEEITLTYKITLRKGEPAEKPAFVEGEFNYLDNQETKKFFIPKEEIAVPTVSEPIAVKTEPVNTESTKTEPAKTEKTKAENTKTGKTKTESVAVNTPKNDGVFYVVQVGAFKNGVNVDALSQKYGLNGVRTEMAEGYTKCIYGNHGEYKSARDSREDAKTKGVGDAFVAAYNSGKRITVQEALMITSQKWYR